MSEEFGKSRDINTTRLKLRKFTEADRADFVRFSTDPEVNQYIGGRVETEEAANALFDKIQQVYNGLFGNRHFEIWAIEYEGKTIGSFELKQTENTEPDELEVVYLIDKAYWGRGFIPEILRCINKYAHSMGLRVIATLNPDNKQTVRALEKAGLDASKSGWIGEEGDRCFKVTLAAPGEGITIRRAVEDDTAAITKLYSDTVRNVNARDYTPQQIDVWASSAKNISRWQAAVKEQYFILAEISGKLAGFSSITPDGYLDFMYVSKDFQRCGAASALLAEIENKAHVQNNSLIYAHVSATARGFFEKNGYIVREVVEDRFGGVVFMNNVMEKRIS
ncbi:MAG: GNAT family N-acetyltransferase [Ignavibacteria bacterium]|nr:GNAT family N-acetyltransferase [Ignavibacteria bacterium]